MDSVGDLFGNSVRQTVVPPGEQCWRYLWKLCQTDSSAAWWTVLEISLETLSDRQWCLLVDSVGKSLWKLCQRDIGAAWWTVLEISLETLSDRQWCRLVDSVGDIFGNSVRETLVPPGGQCWRYLWKLCQTDSSAAWWTVLEISLSQTDSSAALWTVLEISLETLSDRQWCRLVDSVGDIFGNSVRQTVVPPGGQCW